LESLKGLATFFTEIFVRRHTVKPLHIAEASASIKRQIHLLEMSNRRPFLDNFAGKAIPNLFRL